MMNLRLATRDSIERAIAAFEEATRHDPEYAIAWAALGGAYRLKGIVPQHPRPRAQGRRDGAARARDRSRAVPTRTSGSAPALLTLGETDEAIAAIREAIRLEPDNGQAHQGLGRALWVGKGDFAAAIPEFEGDRAQSGSRLLLPAARAAAGVGRAVRASRGSLQARRRAAGSVHLGQRRPADRRRQRPARLRLLPAGPLRRGAARIRARAGVHRLERSRAQGADRHRAQREARRRLPPRGQPDDAARHLRPRAEGVRASPSRRAPTIPFTRYYIACLQALRGERDRAFDCSSASHGRLPALTAARARRDPDLDSLRDDPRFAALATA